MADKAKNTKHEIVAKLIDKHVKSFRFVFSIGVSSDDFCIESMSPVFPGYTLCFMLRGFEFISPRGVQALFSVKPKDSLPEHDRER
jgi:hypothetical protein